MATIEGDRGSARNLMGTAGALLISGSAFVSGILCAWVIWQQLGLLMAIIALVLFPFAALFGPWIVGFGLGFWIPAWVMYGGGALGAVAFFIGER